MGLKINLNGKLVEKAKAVISVFDHGLLYGDGVFEGIRAYNGRVFKLDEHLDRLFDSAWAIKLKCPISKEQFKKEILKTLKANHQRDAYIRAVLTRGEGDLGLNPNLCPMPTYFIITDKIKLYPQEFYVKGLAVMTVPTRRNISEALNPRIKSLNYLNNILAKIEANNYGVLEAIMLNSQGFVAECTGDNLFIVKKGTLITPPAYVGVLEGITRATVIELAHKQNLKVSEVPFTLFDIYTAEECFMTGTAAEIVPVVNVDDRPIGDGKPGKKTLRLVKEFRALTQSAGVPII